MKQARILSKAEFNRVLAVISTHKHAERNRAMFMLSFYGGMRACEVCSLRIQDVCNEDYTVKNQIVLEAHMTKGNERSRVIVSTTLQKALQRYVDSFNKSKPQFLPFIRSQKGGFFSPNSLVQVFLKFYAKAGVSGASSHSGRRQFITDLAEKQVNMRVIQALARHKNMSTTSRYIDVNDVKLQKAVELMTI